MYVNQVAMLVSLSRDTKFAMVEAIPNNKTTTLVEGVKAILQIYRCTGFKVEVALMDRNLAIYMENKQVWVFR